MAIGCICCCLPCISAKSVDFDNILNFFSCFHTKIGAPVCAEKSYHILNFLIQTIINVSDNGIAMVVHNSNSIAMVLPAMQILSQ